MFIFGNFRSDSCNFQWANDGYRSHRTKRSGCGHFIIRSPLLQSNVVLVTGLLLGCFLTFESVDSKSFQRTFLPNGTTLCAQDKPDSVVSLDQLNTGLRLASGVCLRDEQKCAWHCQNNGNCTSFNYNGIKRQCEEFYRDSVNYTLSDSCTYFQNGVDDGNCRSDYNVVAATGLTMIRAPCCALPFTFKGQVLYGCTRRTPDNETLECPVSNSTWMICLPPDDFKADYVTVNLTVPNTNQPVPSIFIHGWLIIQKNDPGVGSIFNRLWIDYRNGFGDPAGKYYWFGNEKLYQMFSSGNWKLRVEVKSSDTGKWYSAEYESFRLSDEVSKYTINVSGYTGDAGDAFNVVKNNNYYWKANGIKFSTFDQDNDNNPYGNCGMSGGWWWNQCGTSFLNAYATDGNSWGTLELFRLAPSLLVSTTRMMMKKN